MQFGLSVARSVPLTRADEQMVAVNTLEQARVADARGCDSAWAVGHHLCQEHPHGSAPDVVPTAMQTERIRSGHGAGVRSINEA